MKRTKHVHLRVYLFLHPDVKSLQIWNHIWSKICLQGSLWPTNYGLIHMSTELRQFGCGKPLTAAGASNTWQNIFSDLQYFSGFSDNSWICKFLWDLQNNICGFNNFIKICNSFSDLINSSTMISKKHYDLTYFFRILKTFFSDFVNILGLSLIGFHSFILEVGCKLWTSF